MSVPLCTYYIGDGNQMEVTDKDIRAALKSAAAMLNYPSERGIPIERIDTHSVRSGGANALALPEYSEHQIQKMCRWKGKTFKEYIRDELHCFSEGMSRSMRKVLCTTMSLLRWLLQSTYGDSSSCINLGIWGFIFGLLY